MIRMLSAAVLVSLCAATTPPSAVGQSSADALVAEIEEADAAAFAAFNDHDLEALMGFFTKDLEFFHDNDGMIGYDDVAGGFGSLFAQDNGLRRELVVGSMEVHPIPGYGAMQIGRHEFCHREGDRDECGEFGFSTVWRLQEGQWKMARVLSYGH